jgi:hypothetical protein
MGRRLQLPSARDGQLIQVLDERKHRAIQPLHLGVLRLYDVVLIRRVCAASMSQAEVACRQAQRLAGEDVARPGPGAARPEYRVDPGSAVHCGLRADE